jgi:hypothetical protein
MVELSDIGDRLLVCSGSKRVFSISSSDNHLASDPVYNCKERFVENGVVLNNIRSMEKL